MELLEKKTNEYTGIYRGLVLDNVDPDKYGRIKIRVYPMFSSLNAIDIPWAVPAFSLWEGAGLVDPNNGASGGIGSFVVPKVNTHVFVFFENGDIYQPVYFAEAPTALWGLPASRVTNYPDRKVFRTRGGIEVYIDDKIKEIKLIHPTGTNFIIDQLGNVFVTVVTNVTETVALNVNINVGGNVNLTAVGNITIQGATVHINP